MGSGSLVGKQQHVDEVLCILTTRVRETKSIRNGGKRIFWHSLLNSNKNHRIRFEHDRAELNFQQVLSKLFNRKL